MDENKKLKSEIKRIHCANDDANGKITLLNSENAKLNEHLTNFNWVIEDY